jgi:hypothetical protein
MIDWSYNTRKKHYRGRPYAYSTTIILRCFIVRIWFRLDSNRSLHHYLSIDLPFNRKVMGACGLSESHLPSRRTYDRRLKAISADIKERISTMGYLFVATEGLVADPSIAAIDSTLLKAKGHVWHKSSMEKGVVPPFSNRYRCKVGMQPYQRMGIWIQTAFNIYNRSLAVPLTAADVTTANVQDNQMYIPLASSPSSPSSSSSSVFSLPSLRYMTADPGYDDKKLYGHGKKDLGNGSGVSGRKVQKYSKI